MPFDNAEGYFFPFFASFLVRERLALDKKDFGTTWENET